MELIIKSLNNLKSKKEKPHTTAVVSKDSVNTPV
jgi:hypothetical protein